MIWAWISLLLNDALPKHLPWALWIALDAPQSPQKARSRNFVGLPARELKPRIQKSQWGYSGDWK